MTEREWRLVLEGLVPLNVASPAHIDRETAEVLLWPKTLISGVLSVLVLVALRAFGVATLGDRGVTLFPGLIALSIGVAVATAPPLPFSVYGVATFASQNVRSARRSIGGLVNSAR